MRLLCVRRLAPLLVLGLGASVTLAADPPPLLGDTHREALERIAAAAEADNHAYERLLTLVRTFFLIGFFVRPVFVRIELIICTDQIEIGKELLRKCCKGRLIVNRQSKRIEISATLFLNPLPDHVETV